MKCSPLRIALRTLDYTLYSELHSALLVALRPTPQPLAVVANLALGESLARVAIQTLDWSAEWVMDWSAEWSVVLQFNFLSGGLFGEGQYALQKFWSAEKRIALQILIVDWRVDCTP